MNIPIVQGVAVPSGTQDLTPYVTTDEGHVTAFRATENQQQQKQFQDVSWAFLFVAHLVAIVTIIMLNISSYEGGGGSNYNGVIWMVGFLAVLSIGISCASLGFMMRYPTELVKSALIFSVGMSGAMAVLGFMTGQVWVGLFGLLSLAIGVCYAKAVWQRIPFAAANLNVALTAVKANMGGLTLIAVMMQVIALGWSILWFLGLGEAVSSSNGAVLFLLLVSYYWVHQVLSNVVHVTSAGTVATWWFVPFEAASYWSKAVRDSFSRATTYSFGSICFGSLLVAIVQSLRAIAHMARDNEDAKIILCVIECILALIQDIIEYLNKWAYVYVGIYGFGYIEAGRNVIELFQQKGWTVIISDDLCDRVLFMISLGIGFLAGLIGWAMAAVDADLLAGLGVQETGVAGFVIGLIVGFVFSSILLSVVGSAVNTVIVCYAEAPAEFESNYPQLSAEMRAAWMQAWPGLLD